MWIGTNGGLNRYDGSSFIQYSVLSQPALTNSVVTTLMEDAKGSIWIGTENGLNILNPFTNDIQQFVHNSANPSSIPEGPIRAVQKMSDGSTWILSDQWMAKFNSNKSFTPVTIDTMLRQSNMVFTAVAEHSANELWISYLDQVTALVKRTSAQTGNEHISDVQVFAPDYAKMYINGTETWSVSAAGIKRYNNASRSFENWLSNSYTPNTPNLHVHICYAVDADGNIWQGSELANLVKYDLRQKKVTDYSWLLGAVNATLAYCTYKDNNNNIWVGTDNGILKISNRTSVFSNIPFLVQGQPLKNIRCRRIVAGKNDILYAGTENYGFLKLKKLPDGTNAVIPLSKYGGIDIGKLKYINNRADILLDGKYDIGFMYDMHYDGGDYIWLAGFGISRYDIRTDSLQIFLTGGTEWDREQSINQFAICYDGNKFWTGGQHNVYTFDPKEQQLRPFADNKGNKPFLETWCWSLAQQGDWIWAGTYKGLYKINSRTNEVVKVTAHPAMESGINDISIDADSSLWLSTAGGGIIHYTEKTKQVRQYTNADGLSNNTVCGLLRDDKNNLWISTYAGLSYFDRQTSQFTNFYTKDGLNTDEFNRKAFTRLPDGRMIFGGLNGYTIFNPDDAFKRDKPVNILLTRFNKITAGGNMLETTFGINTLKKVVIDPGDKFFSFHFTLTDLYDPTSNRYFYQLQGLEDTWHSTGNQGNVSFNGLPAGTYTLKVRGNLGKGSSSVNELMVEILVRQVFYKTTWFLALVLLAIAGIIYAIARYRINQVKKIQYLRTQIASDLHDEVGSSLVHITLLADAVKREGGHEQLHDKLGSIAGISRGAVSTMKDVIWSIDARNDTIAGLIDHMHEHIHTALVPANIEFVFTQQGLQEQEKLSAEFRQNVYLIFKEAINNVVKHSGATQVQIDLKKEHGYFSMLIKDDGKGIAQLNRSSGQGISNMHMRAARLKGTLEVVSPGGATIWLKIPC